MTGIDGSVAIPPDARIAAFSTIGGKTSLGASFVLGPHCTLEPEAAGPQQGGIIFGDNVSIGAGTTIRGSVLIGDNVRIGDGVTLRGPLIVGPNSEIFDGAIIGNFGQFPGRHQSGGQVEIGAGVTVRELVVINQPTLTASTRIDDGSYLMARSQIDHDCQIGEGVKLASGVTLGGTVTVGDYAYLGMNAVVHQGLHIGAQTMIGMNSSILKHVPPYALVVERKFVRINAFGLQRRGFSADAIASIEHCYRRAAAAIAGYAQESDSPWLEPIARFYTLTAGERIMHPSFTGA